MSQIAIRDVPCHGCVLAHGFPYLHSHVHLTLSLLQEVPAPASFLFLQVLILGSMDGRLLLAN